jgi:outer membrane protein
MRLHKSTPALLALLLVFGLAGVASAETRVAFVEVARLLQESPQVQAVRDRLKNEFSRRDNELVAQQKQLKQLEEKLARDGAIMSAEEAKKLERDIIARSRKLKSDQTAFQEDLALRQNEELGKLRKVIAEIIIEVAKDEKIDLVLESGVVWASDRVNMTDKVLARLRK